MTVLAYLVAGLAIVLLAHTAYCRRVTREDVEASSYRLPLAPYSAAPALAFVALVVVLLFFGDSGRTAIVVGIVWFARVVAYVLRGRTAVVHSSR